MYNALSQQLAKLIHAECRSANSPQLKSELLDLAKFCQVVPEQSFLLETTAGELATEVKALFGPAYAIVVLTEQRRRHVYFAVIAHLLETGTFRGIAENPQKRLDLIRSFILESSERIIEMTFGQCPDGFIRVLSRLGQTARSREFYTDLYRLVAEAPFLVQPMLMTTQKAMLSDSMLETLCAMPRVIGAVELAVKFDGASDYRRFIQLYKTITRREWLSDEHFARMQSGEKPAKLIESLYLCLPFCSPIINEPSMTYVRNGLQMREVSRRFNNCFRYLVAEGLKNATQYYVWERRGHRPVVFSIVNERPFGWHLSECKHVGNKSLSSKARKELEAILNRHGIRTDGSIEDLVRPYRSDYDPNELENELNFLVA